MVLPVLQGPLHFSQLVLCLARELALPDAALAEGYLADRHMRPVLFVVLGHLLA